MKTLFAKKNLFLRVAVGFVLGVLLGFLLPEFSIDTKVVGDIYLNLIKLMIIPIVVCAVFCGIANIRDGALLRKIGLRTVLLYVILFVVSSAVSLAIAYTIRPGFGTVFDNAPQYEGSITNPTISSFLTTIVPTNIVQAAADGSTLPVILFTIVFAVAIVAIGDAGKPVVDFMNSLSRCWAISWSFRPSASCRSWPSPLPATAPASSVHWPNISPAAGCAASWSFSWSWCCPPACTQRCLRASC